MHAHASLDPTHFPAVPPPAERPHTLSPDAPSSPETDATPLTSQASASRAPRPPSATDIPSAGTSNAPEMPSLQGWAATFLAPDLTGPVVLRTEAIRFCTGAGLASLYGLALGTRQGGTALLHHALGVPAAHLAVAGLAVPALFIALALFDAPLDPPRVVASAARAAASSGLVLAGLAPAAALYVVTSESPMAALVAGVLGLMVGGFAGVTRLLHELRRGFDRQSETSRIATSLVFAMFALFATVLAGRVWLSSLPILGGAL
ncbi:hypothetical protein [Chondromyces crocatus]|uniref:Uncharacterized protein n=1 Tax=Chondromyces crocatus TaxID=52 RepID=A0A0K1ELM3_CHOCO|nr:hypothetical protein [Chondromyces crocatus]AKT41557.1 uncharacterized protein CMC5_057640 [Chondromyces crocatus]